MPGVEVKIADDGEICVRGKNVFKGYYRYERRQMKHSSMTGSIRSDLGAFDSEGFLSITGHEGYHYYGGR